MNWDLLHHTTSLTDHFLLADFSSRLQAIGAGTWSIFQVIVGLGFVIFVHELGHFLAAKFFGVKCEKFYVGFDVPIRIGPIKLPSKLAKFQWGETEYGIGIIPLGGYVKMLGQDDDPRKAEEERRRIEQTGTTDGPEQAPKLDPRSYPAKTVFARMVIISAGVVMNIIFAAIMAAWAFMIGVPYVPAVIGSVTPGDPAWVAGIQPGDKVLQFGVMDRPNPKMYFDDIQEAMMYATFDDPTRTIRIVVDRESNKEEFSVVGTPHDTGRKLKRFVVGVVPAESTALSQIVAISLESNLKKLDLKGGDRIVAVDGTVLPIRKSIENPSFADFLDLSEKRYDQPIEATVERSSKEGTQSFSVQIPPQNLKTFGFGLELGPVHAVQLGSPAEKAGIQTGDLIVECNGKTQLDALTLHLEIARLAGQEIRIAVARRTAEGIEERRELTWTVPETIAPNNYATPPGMQAFELPGSGIAYKVSAIINRIDENQVHGLQVGDELQQYQIVVSPEQKAELLSLLSQEAFDETALVGARNPIMLQQLVQSLPPETEIRYHVLRNKTVTEGTSKVALSDAHYLPGRGLVFRSAQLTHRAESIGEALTLGIRETKRRLGDVLTFLRLAVTGKISARVVGGPIAIFSVASEQASQGISKLLMFLTLLSANLAILNFLPIPALDGGHMLFLTLEAIRGKPLDEKLQASASMIGVLALLALMVFVFINDILRFTSFG